MQRALVTVYLGVAIGVLGSATAWAEVGPSIDHQPISSVPVGKPVEIRARIVSNSSGSIYKPCVFVRAAGVASFSRMELTPVAGVAGLYTVTIPAALITGPFEYYLEASDTEGNGPTSLGAVEAPLHVQVTADVPPAATPAPTPAVTSAPAPLEKVTPLVVLQSSPADSTESPIATYALLGGGAAGVIGGVVLMVVGNGILNTWLVDSDHLAGANATLTPAQIDSEHHTANAEVTVGGCLLGAGVAAAGAGLYLWLSAPAGSVPSAAEKKAERDDAARHPTVASLLMDF